MCAVVMVSTLPMEMKAERRHVAPNHIASKRQSSDSKHEVSRAGAPNLYKLYYLPAFQVLGGLCAPRDFHTICASNPDLVQFPLASTVVSCPIAQPLASSAQLPVPCETVCQLPPPSELLSRDSELHDGMGRQRCEVFLKSIHQNCPSGIAFP